MKTAIDQKPALETPLDSSESRWGRGAFTLIELLTVISIIAVLAAIGAGLGGVAIRKAREARINGELGALTTAIHSYEKDMGHYPPDHARNGTNANPAVNQLYYELTGTVSSNKGQLYVPTDLSRDAANLIPSTKLQTLFNVQGFVNASETPGGEDGRPRNYLPNLKASQHKAISLGPAVEVLVLPLEWPNKAGFTPPLTGFTTDPKLLRLNPWQYVSTRPTNNRTGFDLWGDAVIGKQFRRFGNWKE